MDGMAKKKGIRKLLPFLSINTPVKKRKTRTVRKNNRVYAYPRNTLGLKKLNNLSEFDKGRIIARVGLSIYNSQTNHAPGYVGNTRVHHGEIGTLSLLLGVLTNDQWLVGAGTELMIDDIHDVNEWFTFKQLAPNTNSLNYNVKY